MAELEVITKAIDLLEYTMRVTSNREKYPVKYVTLIKRMQNRSMDIYEYLLNANRANISTSKQDRQELQSKAISCCGQLSCYVELSMNLNLIGDKTVKYWQSKINDVKYMAIKWRSIDHRR